jgi:aminopeptidase YwaD
MRFALRAAATAAVLAASAIGAQTAAAAPPSDYDQEIIGQFDSANSVETIRHLAVDIGPRRSGTPQEREGAEYLKGILDNLGFHTQIYSFPVQTNPNVDVHRAVAQVSSPNATLTNGPHWQFSSSLQGRQTGTADPVTADVVYAGTGASAADFPAATAGNIALVEQGANTAARNAQVANAVAAGAKAVVVAATGLSAAGVAAAPPTVTLTTTYPDVPIMGAGRSHLDWMKQILATQSLTLTFTTMDYVNPMRSVVVGRRFAVNDPDGTNAPIVMVGAHIDSVTGAPGAHDDASGNGVSMEIARVVSKLPLDKEIRIGGFGGEEDGLTGSRAYVNTLPAQERARFVGEWQMDMVGTPYAPAKLWALTPDGKSNFVVDEAYKASDRFGFTGLQNCKLGQSDHQAFFDVGIPSALFIWLDYNNPVPPATCESIPRGTYTTEPEYHRPADGMNNISPQRLQTTLDVIGGAFAHNAMNHVDLAALGNGGAPVAGATVTGDCGDGVRDFGTTDATGHADIRVPHVTCDFTVSNGGAVSRLDDVQVFGDRNLSIGFGGVGGTVPATLSLSLGAPATFGAFTPGLAHDYFASSTATVLSTAGDATLSVADPSAANAGHLVNGAFALPQALQAKWGTGAYAPVGSVPLALKTWAAPTSNEAVTVDFKQPIAANDALRTGTYAKTLTFTLSTTNP